MFLSGGVKEDPEVRGENVATNGGIKLENKGNEGTALAGKKRKRNRQLRKGAQKLNGVNGEPAGGGKDSQNMKDGELDVTKRTMPVEGTSNKGEMTAALTEATTASNGEPKKKRKRRQKRKKAGEAAGTSQGTVGEDGCPAKKMKTESVSEEKETEKEAPVAETSTENSAPKLSKAQRRKKRKRKIKEAIEALIKSKMATQSQNTTSTTTSTTTEEQPGTQGKNNAKKRKLDDADDSLAGVGDGKQRNMKNENVPTLEMNTGSTEGNHNSQKEGTTAISNEGPVKKRRRKKKPAPNKNATPFTISTLTEEPGMQGKDSAKKRKMGIADVSVVSDGTDNSKLNEDVPTKKMKKDSVEGNQDSQKEATTGADNEGPAKKRKRKRKRKKQGPVGDSTDIVIKEAEDKEKVEVEKDTIEDKSKQEEAKPETTALKRKRKRNRNKKKKNDEKQEGTEASVPNTVSSEHSDTHTAKTEQEASTQDSGTEAPMLHPSCASEESKKSIAESWKDGRKEGHVLEKGRIELIKSPFTCCYIPHLLQDEEYLEGVKKELENIELLTKNNDLYKFKQTGDLKGVTSPFIAGLRHLLYSSVRQWLIDVTGIPLSDTVDMGSSRYSHTDVLLCHDDELEGRRIAYILYLVPPWGAGDGGTLDLFATDGDGHPSDIVRSLIPKNNAFAFFEVSPVSFHQVSEVLSRDKIRLSINGWFHGPPVPRPKRSPPPPSPLQGPTHLEEEDFYAWINPMYLDMNIQKEIRQKFCSESELELENFLTDEAYEKLSKAFRGEGLAWQHTGPADRQRYEILGPDSMPQDIKECQQFLGCEAMFLVLSQLTGLKLHSMAPKDSDDEEEEASAEPNPRCHVEAQRWGPGSYTLIRDDCVDNRAALDAFLYTSVSQQWTQQLGGHVTYIAKDEDEELLTVVPQSNCLCLVYRDAQTLRFTKYITSAARDLGADNSQFQNFAGTYYE